LSFHSTGPEAVARGFQERPRGVKYNHERKNKKK
jgi:hypothetical protein